MTECQQSKNAPIVWIDCEMTGLDLERDELIEIAVVVTDSNLEPLDGGIDIVIKPSQAALDNMGDFVRTMHIESGLLPQLEGGVSLEEATAQVMDYLTARVPEARKAPLGGNSVATDREFLAKQMPAVVEHLHYRIIDVSSIKELAKRWFPRCYYQAPKKFGNHRAIGDIFDSIDELRYYREALFPQGDGPSTSEAIRAARKILDSRTQLRYEAGEG